MAGVIFKMSDKASNATYAVDMNDLSDYQYCGFIGETTINSPSVGKYGTYLNIGRQQIASVYVSFETVKTFARGCSLDGKYWSPWKEV